MESPSINFHARIIIGKLESWLPDSRFVSPNESEREGAQRRAAPSVCAASSRSSRLRAAVTKSPTCDLPVRGLRALRSRPAAQGSRRMLSLPTARLLPSARELAVCKQWAAVGAARPPSGCPTPRSGRRPALAPPHPRLTAAGAQSTTSPSRPCPGEAGAALCAARSGLRRPRPGELRPAVGLSFLSSPHALPLKKSLLQV